MFSVQRQVVVDRARRSRVEHDVLEHGAEALASRRRSRARLSALSLRRLGVAAALEVEDAVGRSSRARRRRSAAAPDRCESVVLPVPERPKNSATSPSAPILAEQCIGSTPCERGVEVEQREHRLLDLAGIGGAGDQDDVARVMSSAMTVLGAGAVARRIGGEARAGAGSSTPAGRAGAGSAGSAGCG